MFEYDAALKILLKGSAEVTIHALSGLTIARWHDVELPRVEEPRVDLLGESNDGRLLHIELQSANDPTMAFRMIEYGVKVVRRYGSYPKQVLLYVGEPPLRMPGEYSPNKDVMFRYRAVDIRELDGDQLLHSDGMGDNVVAILARLGNQREAVRQIVERIASLDVSGRRSTLEQLLILAGVAALGAVGGRGGEANADHREHFGARSLRPCNLKKGRGRSRKAARKVAGLQVGELIVLRRQIAKRFGPIPTQLDERLARCSPAELEELSDRVLDATSVDDLFNQ